MLCLLQLLACVLDVNFSGHLRLLDPKQTHHASVKQVCYLSFHLHVDVLNQHTVDNSDCFEIDGELLQSDPVHLKLIDLVFELEIDVAFVASTLPLERSNALLDLFLNVS